MTRLKKKAQTWHIKGGLGFAAVFVAGLFVSGAFGGISPLGLTSTGDTGTGTSAVSSSDTSTTSTDGTSSASSDTTSTTSSSASTSPYIVTFSQGTSASDQAAAIAAAGASLVSAIAPLSMDSIDVPADSEQAVVDALQANSNVADVERDRSRETDATPSDPGFADQWNLPMIGWDSIYGSGNPLGSSTIAVLDTGVSGSTGDVNLGSGWSAFGTDPTNDPNGHGTAVASIAAATANNGIGIAGVDFGNATILPVQVLDSNGLGQDSDIIQGVVWAADHGANVILMSFSNPGFSQALQDAVNYAWGKGAVVVAATGNDGVSTPTYPAGDAGVMGVAGTDQTDAPWVSSNTGADTFIAAPATAIPADATDGSETSITGTSASAAMVAGAAALLLANDPSATNAIVDGRLARNADPVGTTDQTGNGRLDLARASADTSTDGVTPLGAPGGGPFGGPYVVAAQPQTVTVTNSSVTVNAGDTADYGTITVTFNGNATACTVDLSVTGTSLPSGATAVFGQNAITGSTTASTTFKVTTTTGTPVATTTGFKVTATPESNCQNGSSPKSSSNLTLVVQAAVADATQSTLTPTSSSITANGAATQVLTVQAKTAGGANLVTGGATVTITKQSGTGTIGSVTDHGDGTYTATVTAPTATGSGVFIATLGGNMVKSGTGSQTQATVTYVPGAATQLVFGQQPTSAVSGVSISPAVTVKVEDATGNVETADNSTQVSLAILNNPGSGTLTGGGATTVASGIATFSGLSINKTGTGYTLQATKSGLTSATSNAFNITARSSSASVSCATNPVTYGGSTLCTATVNDSQGAGTSSTPGGTVAFTSNGAGGFTNSGSCTLVGGQCSITYTPSAVGTGTHQITATYTSNDGIHSGSNNNTSVTVNQRNLTITAADESKTYGNAFTPDGTTQFTSNGLQFSDTISSVTLNSSGYAAGAQVSGSPFTITPSAAVFSPSGSSANYSITYAVGHLTVNQRNLTITAADESKTYGNTFTPDGTTQFSTNAGGLANGDTVSSVTLTSSGYAAGAQVSGSPFTITPSAAGFSPGSASGNYNISYANGHLTVNQRNLTITAANESKTYGNTFVPNGTTQFSTNAGGLANGDTVASVNLSSAGYAATAQVANSPFTITPSAATFSPASASGNYNINYANGSLTVNQRLLTITARDESKTYGNTYSPNGSTEFMTDGNEANGDTVSSVTLSSAGYAAGAQVDDSPFDITPSAAVFSPAAAAGNYAITYAFGALTVNKRNLIVTASNESKIYGDTYTPDGTTEFSTNGNEANGDTVASVSLNSGGYAATAQVDDSPFSITASAAVFSPAAAGDNYSVTYDDGSFTVNKRDLTITASDESKTYGDTYTPDGSTEFSTDGNEANGDTVSSVTLNSGGYAATAQVDDSPFSITASAAVFSPAAAGDNYSVTYDDGSFTVNKRDLTVTATNEQKTYGDTYTPDGTSEFSTDGNEANGDTVSSVTLNSGGYAATAQVDDSPFSITPSAAVFSPAGAGDNYSITYDNALFTVNKRDLTITASNASKTYGDTYTPDGSTEFSTDANEANGDTVASVTLSSAGYAATAQVDDSPFAITPSAAVFSPASAGDNYSITYDNALFTVNKRDLTITASDASKTYGDTYTPDGTSEFTTDGNEANGDTVASVSLNSGGYAATAQVDDSPFGITASAAVFSPAAAGDNYSVTYDDGSFTVNKRDLTITASDASKTYGDTYTPDGTSEFTTDGNEANGDTVSSVTLSSAGYAATAQVDDSPFAITPSAAVFSPVAAGDNYSVTYDDGSFTVNKRDLTILASDASKTYGDTYTPDGSTEFSTDGNEANGDTVSSVTLSSAGYAATAQVDDSPFDITPSAAVFSPGAAIDNYSITYALGAFTVNKRNLTVTASDASKIYGDTYTPDGTSEFTTDGNEANGDTVSSVTLSSAGYAATAQVDDSPFGITASAAVFSPAAAGDNYSVTYDDGSFTVNKRDLTITASDESKTYGDTYAPNGSTEFTTDGNEANGDIVSSVSLDSAGYAATAQVDDSPFAITPSAAVFSPAAAGDNYSVTYDDGSFTVNKRDLTIIASDASKTYGDTYTPDGSSEFTTDGNEANGDTVSSVTLSSAGYAATAQVDDSPFDITPSDAVFSPGAAFDNYSITYALGSFTVNKRDLTITASDEQKTYGDTYTPDGTSEFGTDGNEANGDTVDSVSLNSGGYAATAQVDDSPFGITASAAVFSPAAAGDNYSVTYDDGSFTVNKRDLTITASDESKTYGDTYTPNGSTEFTTDGNEANGDTVASVTLDSAGYAATAQVDDSPFAITPSTAVFSPAAAMGNYSITYSDGSFIVNQAQSSLDLQSSVNPSTFTQSVTFTATISGYGGGTSTGSVDFSIDGGPATTKPVSGNAATLSTSSLSVGTHTVHAIYGGDDNLIGSNTDLSPDQQVNTRSTATTVVCSPSSVDAGAFSIVSCTATVTDTEPAGTASAPGGTVSFNNNGALGLFVGSPCTLSSVDSSSSSCDVMYNPAASAPAGIQNIDASYTANDSAHGNSSTNTPFPLSITTHADVADLKVADHTTVLAGNAVTFTSTITNNGPSDAQDVMLTDDLSAFPVSNAQFCTFDPSSASDCSVGGSWSGSTSIGTLGAGDSVKVKITATVDPSTPSGTTITNSSTASSTTSDPTPGNETGTANTITVHTAAQLTISKSGPATATAGTAFTYHLTVTNDGPSNALNINVSDTVPGSFSSPSYTVDGGPSNSWTGSAYLGTLAAGQTVHIDITGTPTLAATIHNSASVATTTSDAGGSVYSTGDVSTVVSAGSATSLKISGLAASTTAGQAQSFTVTAYDAYNNVATGYTGTVHFTSTDSAAGASVPADYTFNGADAGAHNFFAGATFVTAGTQTLTTTDTGNASLTDSANITVNPADATHFTVSGYPSPTIAGVAHSFNVTAKDQFGNTDTNYSGTVHFTSTDGQADLPADSGLTSGTGSFTATLKTSGSQSITATDIGSSSIDGSQTGITVNPANTTHFVVSGYPASTTAGDPHSFNVTAKDAYGNTTPAYAGTVHFTSSDAQAILPANSTLSSGAGSFAATLATAGTQSITATDSGNSSITGTQSGITVTAAGATHFTVSGYQSPTTAGDSHSFTVTAKDQFGNTDTNYVGTVHFTSSDGLAILPADSTLTSGTGSFNATLRTAGSQSITATDTSDGSITGSQSGITVSPAGATHFTVIGYPSPTIAGVSHSFNVTALDAFGNTDTNYSGTVHFTSTDGQAVLPADSGLTSGTGSFNATLKTVGTQTISAIDSIHSAITGSSGGITVNPADATHFTVSGYPSPTIAGVAHSFNVTAKDAFNNVATGYSGTVHFTSSDGTAILPANSTLSIGSGNFVATLKTAGSQSITATDTVDNSITGTQSGIMVSPAGATHFTVSGYPSTTIAGDSHSFTVTAKDQFGNTDTNYSGTVHFTSTDGNATLPANSTLTSGTGSFNATLKTAGSQSITATDTSNGSITGSQSGITVNAANAASLTISGLAASTTAGQSQPFTVTVRDSFNNVATGYSGTVHFSSSDAQAVLPSNSTLTSGVGTFNATFKTAGSQSLTATDTANSSLTDSKNITVSAGMPTQLAFLQQPSSTVANQTIAPPVTVEITDAYGNLVSSANDTIGLSIDPAHDPSTGSAMLSGGSAVATSGGIATFNNLSIDTPGQNYQLLATGTAYGTVSSAAFTITPGNFLSSVAAADPSFKHIDGFDVLFGKSQSGSTYSVLKNTNPGTFHYQLTLTNETGTTIHGKGTKLPPKYVNNVAIDDNDGASATAYLTVPSLPANVSTPIPTTTNGLTDPAFTLQGKNAVHVHPGDNNDGPDMNGITIKWLAAFPSGYSDCSQVPDPSTGSPWQTAALADGQAVKCIKIDGFSIPKHGKAKVDVNYEFRLKNTDKWASNAQLLFRAGFAFKSTTSITFDNPFPITSLQGQTLSGNQAVGLVGAGQQVTAIGGFLFDTNANPISGATVRLYNSQAAWQASGCSATNEVAHYVTQADGFYFIENTGVNDSTTTTNGLASGVNYFVAVCQAPGVGQAYWPARAIGHNLGNKEFDEEDFYVAAPAAVKFGGQPSSVKVNKSLGTVTVTVIDGFGNVVTADGSDTIALSLNGSGTLGGTSSKPVSGGLASFTNLTVNTAGSGDTLTANSSPFSATTTSNTFNISP